MSASLVCGLACVVGLTMAGITVVSIGRAAIPRRERLALHRWRFVDLAANLRRGLLELSAPSPYDQAAR